MPRGAKVTLALNILMESVLHSDSNTTSKHAPQVERTYWNCRQFNQLNIIGGPTPENKPLSWRITLNIPYNYGENCQAILCALTANTRCCRNKRSTWINGPKQLYIPGLWIIVCCGNTCIEAKITDSNKEVLSMLSSLLSPSLVKVIQHIPSNWTFQSWMNIMPGLTWSPRFYGSTIEVGLMEILFVDII